MTSPAEGGLILDSGGVSMLASRSGRARALVTELVDRDLWPPRVPSAVLVECLTGRAGKDAPTKRLLKECHLDQALNIALARRAASLRTTAGTGSAVDAVVVACAEPNGVVLTTDHRDIAALAQAADGVEVFAI